MELNYPVVEYIFKKYLVSKSFKENTVKRYMREMKDFFNWLLDKNSKNDLRDIVKQDILEYRKHIFVEKKKGKDELRYKLCTQRGIMTTLFLVFRYFFRNEYILINPFDGLDLRMVKTYKTMESISEEDINLFLDSINEDSVLGLRDRAMFELMYGTGLRVGEVVKLDITDMDLNAGKLFIRQGKGGKDRIVPLGNNVLKHLKNYIKYGRPVLLDIVKDNTVSLSLFLSLKGNRVNVAGIEYNLKKRFKEAGIRRKVSPHILRHTFATHMLEHGARIEDVKDILGHKSIQTTVIYTHFSVTGLKRILKMRHPRENELFHDFEITDEFLKSIKK